MESKTWFLINAHALSWMFRQLDFMSQESRDTDCREFYNNMRFFLVKGYTICSSIKDFLRDHFIVFSDNEAKQFTIEFYCSAIKCIFGDNETLSETITIQYKMFDFIDKTIANQPKKNIINLIKTNGKKSED